MYYCFQGTYFHSRMLPGMSEPTWHILSAWKNLLCFWCFIIIPTVLIFVAVQPLLPKLGLSHLSSVYLLLPSSSTSFPLFFSVYCSPWITPLLADSLSSAVLNGALEKAACLLLGERALISLAESSSRSAPRGKLRNAACRGGRWDRTFFWSFLAPFNLSIKVG